MEKISLRDLSKSAQLSLEENIQLFRALTVTDEYRKQDAYVGQIVIQIADVEEDKATIEAMSQALAIVREMEKKRLLDLKEAFSVDPSEIRLPKIFKGYQCKEFLKAKRERKIAILALDSHFVGEFQDACDFTRYINRLHLSDARLVRIAVRYFYRERITIEDARLIITHFKEAWKFFQPGRSFKLALKLMREKMNIPATSDDAEEELGSLQLAENYPGLIDDIVSEIEDEESEAERKRTERKKKQDELRRSGVEGWKKTEIDRFEALQKSFNPDARPTLQELAGYGEAGEWGLQLAEDLKALKEERLEWSDIDRGILLSGPPGCGKTTFAKALAETCGVHLIHGSYSIWQAAGHQGDMLRYMQWCFTAAKRLAPCILFIDEIDTFSDRGKMDSSHGGMYMTEVVNALLAQVDGVEGREGVIVVGATNNPSRVDPALKRSGRLDRHIVIPLPNENDRSAIFSQYLNRLPVADAAVIAASSGMSGADIERCCREARRIARKAGREVVTADLLQCMPERHMLSQSDRRISARHELGHAFVAEALKVADIIAIQISGSLTMSDERYFEMASVEQKSRHMHRSSQHVKDYVCGLLGGRAADELLSGGAHAGAMHDLEMATQALLKHEHAYGLGNSLVYLGDSLSVLHLDRDLKERVEAELQKQLTRAKRIVAEHSDSIKKLAHKLATELTLDPDLVRQAVRNHKRLVMLQ